MSERALMKMDMVKNLAFLLMKQNNSLTMEQALSIVFNSDTFQKLQDDNTHLYYQSARYTFSFLEKELTEGKMA